jgi:hypothetical protein
MIVEAAKVKLVGAGATSAAERMRRHRRRRLKGLRCLTVELRETEIDALVHRGMLDQGATSDARAIRKALYRFLSATLTDRA